LHNNFYLLRKLTVELESLLKDSVISECFSQNKEELILRFEIHRTSFYIKASLQPIFSCLSFSENFQRARKNSVDLFEKIIGLRVIGFRQFENERSFSLILSNNFSLLFKMHGNRSNILLFENETLSELFKKNIKADIEIQLDKLNRDIDWTFAAFEKFHENPSRLYFTFGKIVWQYLNNLGYSEKTIDEKWNMITNVRSQLESGQFHITIIDGKPVLSLLPAGKIVKAFTRATEALNEYFYVFTHAFTFEREKTWLITALQAKLESGKNYQQKTQAKLNDISIDTSYKIWADLIMANLHNIPPNSEKVVLENFYSNNHPTEVRLKKDLSPQKNAELYYRKSKNQQIEISRLEESLTQKQKEIEWTHTQLEKAIRVTDLKSLRALAAGIRVNANENNDKGSQVYHEFESQGFRIWVGKNAQNNDILTFKLAYKEDLWLHAKDVAGSHVIIKYQAGKKFPKEVIERAAQLAAYNSKRKTETLCPVIVTPRKFVRKRKGDPAGAVVIQREDVILVEPKL
jgi:predicted ribosome quality control (RQC) complex YloA/Tae2 family protein